MADGNGLAGTVGPADVSSERVRGNLLRFGRRLRAAGMPVGSGQVLGSVEALAAVEVGRRDDVYSAAKATLVTAPEQIPIFDAEFSRFWRDLTRQEPAPLEQFVSSEDQESLGLPRPPGAKQEPRTGDGRAGAEQERTVLVIEGTEDASESSDDEEYEVPPEDVLIFSAREALRKKDFAQLTPEELNEARRIIEGMTWRLGTRQTRRRQRAVRGDFIDYRQTLRGALKHGGMPVELRWRKRKERMRPLVLICDISGSMDRYARLLLRFVHALEHGLEGVEVFVFGTRLTRITRELRRRDVDQAIQDVVASVDDWSGGTRIGEAIKTFNYRWSRRVLRSGATVVIISDGWDRGDPALLGQEMARLQRSSRRLIWLNPLLGAPGYQPLTQGIRAALPFVDHFLPVHNLRSLEALAALLSSVEDQPPVRRQASSQPVVRG
ncbi:MAG: VWA domain-containing protein [Chloroflexota bacterium]|nr:VWA domain-containing protein [Chloroflexota bacterium]